MGESTSHVCERALLIAVGEPRLLPHLQPDARSDWHQKLFAHLDECPNVSDAILQIEATHYDVILPTITGTDTADFESLAQIRSARTDVPIVVLTANTDEATVLSILKSGAEDYVDASDLNHGVLAKSIRFAIERSKLIRERIQLQKLVLESGRSQRQRISSDLHDSIGQELTGLNMLAHSLSRRLHSKQLAEAGSATEIADGIQSALRQIRNIINGLMPVPIQAEGLRSSLDQLCVQTFERTGIECKLECPVETLYEDNETATQIFRIAQESVNNAVKHAEASRILVRFERRANATVLQVVDDGKGFDTSCLETRGHGLRIMNHRSELLGANLQIYSHPESGTVVHCSLNHNRKMPCPQS